METLFLKLFDMSITATWLVLAVFAVRFIFRKTPKWIFCLLWGFVAFRLICPFSIESGMSLIPNTEAISHNLLYEAVSMRPARGDILDSQEIIGYEQQSPAARGEILDSEGNVIFENVNGVTTAPSAESDVSIMKLLSKIWIVGVIVMLAYTVLSYMMLRQKVATAIPLKRGIKQSEYVDSPFVLGVIRPVIYLPFDMQQEDLTYVIAHEKAHIRRGDHWWKPLGFLLLSIYWFNPVFWLAYILLCRDIEAACDEKVIRDMEMGQRRAYSKALLNCSVHHRRIAACPLAFGETGVKERVKSVINYKKPSFWVILIALVVSLAVALCFLTNPRGTLPVTVRVDYVSRTWADMKFIFADHFEADEIQISDHYILETLQWGKWSEVEKLSDEQTDALVIEVESDDADYDAWCTVNLEEHYGRLTDGTYRIRKNVTIHKNSNEVEAYPLDIEFTVGGTAEDLVTYSLEDVTPTGANLYEHEAVEDENQLVYDGSEGFWLEVWQDEKWQYMEPTTYIEPIFANQKHYVHALYSSSDYIELDWSSLYGELPDGKYRLGREVTNTAETDLHVCTSYTEFEIDSDWGIDLMVDKLADNSLAVCILMSDPMDEGTYYFSDATLQLREKISQWSDIIPFSETVKPRGDALSNMSEIELDWDTDLHKLSSGVYRVGIRILRKLSSGETETNIIYEYFDPSEYAWGVSITVSEITQDNGLYLTVEHDGSKNLPDGSLSMSHDFRLEKRQHNQWVPMGPPSEAIPDTMHPVRYGNGYETEFIRISHYYNNLSYGTYRLVKDVTYQRLDGTSETRPVYAVFAFDAQTAEAINSSVGSAVVTNMPAQEPVSAE